jgi:hypothetical protein
MFTLKSIYHAVLGGWVLSQMVIWAYEIRAIGFKQRLRNAATKSYADYFRVMPAIQRRRLFWLWGLFFVGILLASRFL